MGKINNSFGYFRIDTFTIFRDCKALPGGAEIHDAMKFEELNVGVVALGFKVVQKLLDALCGQFSLHRVKGDFRHVNEVTQCPATSRFQQCGNVALALSAPVF